MAGVEPCPTAAVLANRPEASERREENRRPWEPDSFVCGDGGVVRAEHRAGSLAAERCDDVLHLLGRAEARQVGAAERGSDRVERLVGALENARAKLLRPSALVQRQADRRGERERGDVRLADAIPRE